MNEEYKSRLNDQYLENQRIQRGIDNNQNDGNYRNAPPGINPRNRLPEQNDSQIQLIQERLMDGAQMTEAEQQRHREIALKKKADSYIGEMVYNLMIVLMGSLFVIFNKDSLCNVSAKSWIAVAVGCYLVDFILIMFQYHSLKVTQKESLLLMAARYLTIVVLVGWLIYGNVLYYNKSNNTTCATGLRQGMFLLLLIGYFEMTKCCCVGMVVCIMIPLILYSARHAQRPNWMPAPPRFIQNLMEVHFNPSQNQAQESCPICMIEFAEKDVIIPLPCDEKHYFHSECIKSWLERNNNCPLCKKEITKESLKEQKKQMKKNKNKKQNNTQQPQRPAGGNLE